MFLLTIYLGKIILIYILIMIIKIIRHKKSCYNIFFKGIRIFKCRFAFRIKYDELNVMGILNKFIKSIFLRKLTEQLVQKYWMNE